MTKHETTKMPLVGDQAPEFTAETTYREIHFPKDYEGSWVVFFSHPADFMLVCTTEFMRFAAKEAEFAKRNCKLPGLSTDSLYAHIAWLRTIKEKINAILYDPLSNGHSVDEVLRLFTALQTTDAHGVATPAN